MKRHPMAKMAAATLCIVAFFASPVAHAHRRVDAADQARFLATLTPMVQSLIDNQTRLEGQQGIIVAHLSFARDGTCIVVELGKGYLPTDYSFELEEHVDELNSAVFRYMQETTPIEAIDFMFGGKDIFDYFPEERGPDGVSRQGAGNVTADDMLSAALLTAHKKARL